MNLRFAGIAMAAALVALGGCSKSSTTQASSESSSRIASSPFKWSSSSSASDETESAYRRDVRDYTARFAAAPGDVDAFQRDLTAIAEGYGVTDWERKRGTYVAIGHGLARADVDESVVRQLAVALSGEELARLEVVMSAYRSHRAR